MISTISLLIFFTCHSISTIAHLHYSYLLERVNLYLYFHTLGPVTETNLMSEQKRSEVRRVNDAIESNKEAEKMVRQVIGKGENISNEGKHVLHGYFEKYKRFE